MIGVFDSGLGGLTVLRELKAVRPNEDFIYLGDLARLPYGIRSKQFIQDAILRGVDFLQKEGAKEIVLACHTASSFLDDELICQIPLKVHGVNRPILENLLKVELQRILVLATPATVSSELYLKELHPHPSRPQIFQVPCPLLVSLAEEGWWDHAITRDVIKEYIGPYLHLELDGVVLACTHFPLLLPSFKKVFGELKMWSAGESFREQANADSNFLNQKSGSGHCRYFASDRVVMKHNFNYPEKIDFQFVEI